MTTAFKVECSHCGKDLTSTGNCQDYRLDLKVASLPSRGGFVTMMAVYPPLKQDENFCGIACLRQWLANNHPDPAERRIPPESDVLSYGGVTLQNGVTTTPVGSEAILANQTAGTGYIRQEPHQPEDAAAALLYEKANKPK